MSRHPSVKWAQRSDKLFITVQLPDAQDVKFKLEPEGKFIFSATSGVDKTPYEIELDLLDKVNVEESKAGIGSRNIQYIVKKAENKWWSRLIKQTGKPPVFLTVDWDKWIDEDEEFTSKGGAAPDMGDMGFNFPDMGLGGGGFDGAIPEMDDDDENDTEDENVEEASSAEKEEVLPPTASGEAASSAEKEEVLPPTASGEADTKKT
uniref:Co-chaperone protein p23 n=1 Tax=Populus davidiana TaxID=266767 RepID=A0A6M2EQB7_9ROSI